jgi:hypothetical protein
MRKAFKTGGLGVGGGRCWSREAAHSAKRMGAELTEAPSFSLSKGVVRHSRDDRHGRWLGA